MKKPVKWDGPLAGVLHATQAKCVANGQYIGFTEGADVALGFKHIDL